jgi:hypothetical protein
MFSQTEISLNGVHGRSRTDVTAVGLNGTIMHFNGLVWRPSNSGTTTQINAVYCSPDGKAVAVGEGGLVLHNSGLLGEDTPWEPQVSGTSFSLYDVTSAGGNRAYASGFNGLVLEYDDGEWTILTTGFHDRLNSIYMNPCGDILAGGLWGLIIRYGH